MADDDGPTTRPGLPFEPLDIEDGPTLEVYLPSDTVSTQRFRGVTKSDFERTRPDPPSAPAWATPDPILDETATLELPAASEPRTLRLHKALPSFDDVRTTPLGPPSDRTSPFLLVAPPLPSTPIPLVPREPPAHEPLLVAPVLPPARPPAPLPRRSDFEQRGETRMLLVFAAGLLGTLAIALVIVVAVLALRPRERTPSSTTAPAAPSPGMQAGQAPLAAPGAPADGRCRVQRRPQRVAQSVLAGVPPMVAPALNADELAVGLAESTNGALGVVVDLTDLSVERRYSETFTRPVFRATPFESAGSLRFAIDHDDPRLQSARTIIGPPPLVVGVNYFGFVRAESGHEPRTLWPGGRGQPISEPIFASVAGVGHAVAFSRGRAGGSLHVGWLSSSGQPKTDLATLEENAHEIEAPAVAATSAGLLVAVGVRDEQSAPWRIVLATSAAGELPTSTTPMTTGPGPDRRSPSVTALDAGWLVSWIEGSEGSLRVRAQVLNAKLERLEAPFDVAVDPALHDARGALHRAGTHVLALYMLRRERSFELWANVIDC